MCNSLDQPNYELEARFGIVRICLVKHHAVACSISRSETFGFQDVCAVPEELINKTRGGVRAAWLS